MNDRDYSPDGFKNGAELIAWSNGVRRDAFTMREDHELTVAARVKDWEIFSPDWDYLSEFPVLTLPALCALSVGLHPYFADPSWAFNIAIPHYNGACRDEFSRMPESEHENEVYLQRAKKLDLFIRKCHIAAANLEPRGKLMSISNGGPALNAEIRLQDFVEWAVRKKWDLPQELIDARHQEKPEANDNPRAGRPSQHDKKVAAISAFIQTAMESGLNFETRNMPGTASDFLEAIHTAEKERMPESNEWLFQPSADSMKIKESHFKAYREAGCEWTKGRKKNAESRYWTKNLRAFMGKMPDNIFG